MSNAPIQSLRAALADSLIERGDEVDAILTALIAREHVLFVGPPGCLHADTPVYDPKDGTTETVLTRTIRGEPFHVLARDEDSGSIVVAKADAPNRYEPADMFTVLTVKGHEITVTGAHRLWTGERFERVSDVAARLPRSVPVLTLTTSGTVPPARGTSALRSTRTAEDSQAGCLPSVCSDGAPPRQGEGDGQADPPSPADAHGRSPLSSRGDGRDGTGADSRGTMTHRPATSNYDSQIVPLTASAAQHQRGEVLGESSPCSSPTIEPLPESNRGTDRSSGVAIAPHPSISTLALVPGQWQEDHIIAIEPAGRHPYYDFHVPVHENYWACGMIHHNTAKSHAARLIASGVQGCRYVERLLAPTTPPEALWGPISLAALREDRYEHVTAGTVADAELVFLDEVGRASPAILDTLLHLLGPERQALIGTVQVKAPLLAAIGAANTWPEDAAMLDRWLVRRVVKPISRGALGRLLWDELPGAAQVATLADFCAAHAAAAALPVSNDAKAALAEAVSELAAEGIKPSDRRLRASVRIARASAVLHGAAEVVPEHLTALQDVLWNRPEDAGKAGDIIRRVANPTLARLTTLLANTDEVVETAKANSGDSAVRIEAIQKLHEMLKEATQLRGKKGTYDKAGRAAQITEYVKRQAAELQMIALGMDPAKASAIMDMSEDE